MWTRIYPAGVGQDPEIHDESAAHAWRARVAASPNQRAVLYRGRTFTTSDIDREAEALVSGFLARGLHKSSIIGIYLQNVPQFAVALLAAWKVGVVPLVLNPMYRGRELRALIDDSAASAIICDEGDLDQVRTTLTGSSVTWVLTTNDDEYAGDTTVTSTDASATPATSTGAESRPLTGAEAADPEPGITVEAWSDVLAAHRADAGTHRADLLPGLDDAGLLLPIRPGPPARPRGRSPPTATSLLWHVTYGAWMSLGEGDVMLAIAPLFHITGAVATAAATLISDAPLVFINRLHPEVMRSRSTGNA